MRVLGALGRYFAVEDDPAGLFDADFGPLDEVGKIGLEEGERRDCLGRSFRRPPFGRDRFAERREQGLEQTDPIRIEGLRSGSYHSDLALELRGSCSKKSANQAIELLIFLVEAEARGDRLGIVAQAVECRFALLPQTRIEPLLEFARRERPGEPRPLPVRWRQVVKR